MTVEQEKIIFSNRKKKQMQKLVICFSYGDEYCHHRDENIPIEYSSKVDLENDLFIWVSGQLNKEPIKDFFSLNHYNFIEYTEKGDMTDRNGSRYIYTYPEILTLEEWFENKKVSK